MIGTGVCEDDPDSHVLEVLNTSVAAKNSAAAAPAMQADLRHRNSSTGGAAAPGATSSSSAELGASALARNDPPLLAKN